MSGAMRRIGEYLGLLEDTGTYDKFDGYDQYDAADYTRETQAVRHAPAPAAVSDLNERRQAHPRPQAVASVAEVSRITTIQPTTYNDARAIGEAYRAGTPVIMNLGEMSDADAKRLVDFAAGLIFGTHGDIERVSQKVFLLSPANVSIAAEDKARIAQGGFFNQS